MGFILAVIVGFFSYMIAHHFFIQYEWWITGISSLVTMLLYYIIKASPAYSKSGSWDFGDAISDSFHSESCGSSFSSSSDSSSCD